MTNWHHIRHRVTGEEQQVGALEGYDLSEWEVTPLGEEPTQHHHFDAKKKRLVLNHEKKVDHDRHVAAEGLTKADMWEMILDLRERVTKLEKTK